MTDLAQHEKFRHRKTYGSSSFSLHEQHCLLPSHRYIACVQAFVNEGVSRTFFEEHLLEWLPAMSDDLLDVKIALAKLVASICAPISQGWSS